jgi:hypothetical protein
MDERRSHGRAFYAAARIFLTAARGQSKIFLQRGLEISPNKIRHIGSRPAHAMGFSRNAAADREKCA